MSNLGGFKVGDRVKHSKAKDSGLGTVVRVHAHGLVDVRFDDTPSRFKQNDPITVTPIFLSAIPDTPGESGKPDLEPRFGNRSQFEVQKAFVRMLIEKGGVPRV